ncbi:MAG: hypothetical protein LBR17_01220 [Bacteroidales bacterium]|jgi:hypothetical protein|nr:hypothetical protein [Bacteroidales bacterium]
MVSKIVNIGMCVVISLCLSACDPEEGMDPTHQLRYYVTNKSSNNLHTDLYSITYWSNGDSTCYIERQNDINIDSTACVWRGKATIDDVEKINNLFYSYFSGSSIKYIVNVSLNDSLLKQWNSWDTIGINKQFFRESDWSYRTYQNNGEKYIYHEWTFEITDNDLQ